jgi:hypothetical protein
VAKAVGSAIMENLEAQRRKLVRDALGCEMIANFATDEKKWEVFQDLAKQLRQASDDLRVTIAASEGGTPRENC